MNLEFGVRVKCPKCNEETRITGTRYSDSVTTWNPDRTERLTEPGRFEAHEFDCGHDLLAGEMNLEFRIQIEDDGRTAVAWWGREDEPMVPNESAVSQTLKRRAFPDLARP